MRKMRSKAQQVCAAHTMYPGVPSPANPYMVRTKEPRNFCQCLSKATNFRVVIFSSALLPMREGNFPEAVNAIICYLSN